MSRISYLGHAGFIAEHGETRILIDPWFYPAFLKSWFPYPDNRALLGSVVDATFDFLYISHTHEDHFDTRLLAQLDRSTNIVVARFRSKALQRGLAALGFTNIIEMEHGETRALGDITATMFLDTSHKEDSGILLDLDGFRFLDLNDCNTPMSELPTGIDLLAAQFSGAMWYPNCYDYPPHVMQQKVLDVRHDLLDTLYRKIRITGAKGYLPSAGPVCFLDPELADYNDRDATIFPVWDQVSDEFEQACPDIAVVRLAPGDHVDVDTEHVMFEGVHEPDRSFDEDLAAYRARRADEWGTFHESEVQPVEVSEVEAYFARLQRLNKRFLGDFSKDVRLISGSTNFAVRLGELAEYFVIEGEEPYDPEYTLIMSPRVLRAIIEGEAGWEEALLSMRIGLHRDPDNFDLTFMSLLRYGVHPAQTMQMLRERNNTATIERDGLRMQQYCPHAGEDLTFAEIRNGTIECPRHHWLWDAATGRCIDKGNIDLRLEVLDPDNEALRTPSDTVERIS